MLEPPVPELLAAVVNSSDDAIVSKTLQGIITSWNPAAERIFGYTAQEAVGRHITILFPPDRLQEEEHFLREIAAGRRVEHFQTERVRKTGERITVSVTLSPVRDERGTIVGASKIARDISDRVRLERRAAKATADLERILSSLGEGLILLDADLRCSSVNDAAVQMIGKGREEIIGRTPAEIFPRELADRSVPKLRAALASMQVVRYELHDPAADRWYDHRLHPSPDGVSMFFTDITPRKRADEALRRSEESQRFLVALNDATRGLRDPDAVMWEVVGRVGRHFGAGRCTYGDVDAAQQHVLVSRDYTDGVGSVAGRHRLDDFGPLLVQDLKAGRTVVVPDVAADPRTCAAGPLASFAAIETRSLVCVPLVKDARFVALLVLHDRQPRDWTAGEVSLLEQVAERTWYAVETARAEAALRESRDVLALAMRGGRMGAWSRSLTTDEVWWSRELEELFGIGPGGFGGTEAGFLGLVHPDDRRGVEAAVSSAIASHVDYVVEFRFRHAAGDWRWMEGRGRAVYAPDGTPLYLYGLGIDITERKAFEDALAAARDAADSDAERLSLALAAARLGDWSWDASDDFVTMSPHAAQIFDIPPGRQLTWTAMRELLHPDDRERARRAVEEAIATRTDYAVDYRLTNGGRERWVSASGRARYDAQGKALGMFGVVQDITRDRLLVRVDDAVRPLEDPEQITYTAARMLGEHLGVNRCAYAVVDDDQDEFLFAGNYAHGVASIVGRYQLRQFGAECRRSLRAGQPYVVHDALEDTGRDGTSCLAYEATATRAAIWVPILKSWRLVAAMAVHSREPRSWRADEVELVQHVASRCWESIERARVERDRAELLDAAEAANRAKDEFLAMLGHELRNPLSPILTALQLMKLRGDAASERERTVIERQVTHLTRLVDDLLDVSRIARGKVQLKTELVELAEIVASAIEIASPLFEERAQVLRLEVPRTGCAVEADPARLAQVVSNLLTNAAKYTAPGGEVAVQASCEGDEVVLRVRDTGMGIPADVLPRVFDLFVQGRQAIDRAGGGLGLGLTIVKSLVERHGGRVSAHSDGPDRGSEFVVRLPRAQAAAAPAHAAAGSGRERGAAQETRVLVVDDNHDAAEMLAEALKMRGHTTRVAHDGPAALRIASTFAPTVALLDIGLPVMDGYELAARLKELPGLADLRLIALTGYGQDSDRRRTAAAGFHHHLVKPVDLDVLDAVVAGAFSADERAAGSA